ncbi:MAG TPA: class I tRNA ligase family protein [Spirochaetia bacterium]|nr:class I tRNA ligase family protein [Spirochaetia bacterium]
MSRSKQEFKPREDGKVKIFTCGPSIYRRPHIGNYRSFMYEDILVRYLEYLGYEVHRTINFTDVEDKTISEATDQHTTIKRITEAVEKHFFREAKLLQLKLPDYIPRATTSIDSVVKVIKVLLRKKYAYWHDGNVFFEPLKKKDFGKLFRLDLSRWPDHTVRFKRDTYEGNRWNRGDFILWHGEANAVGAMWETELGRGRPSWNIQDPAMIVQTLGDQVDINCGGIDNIYRHHDYNIAIMEAYSGKPYANFYLHGEHLIVDGLKMSKSRGNILYPDDALQTGYKPYHLRFFLYYTHYRKKLNYTPERFAKAAAYVDHLRALAAKLVRGTGEGADDDAVARIIGNIEVDFRAAANDDLAIGLAVDTVVVNLETIEAHLRAGEAGGNGSSGRRLSSRLASELEAALRRIDTVLGAVFA